MRGVRLVLPLAWVVAGMLTHPGAAAARRVALVVGTGAYRSAPALANLPNDARDVARSLRGLGFEVAEGIDLDKAGMEAALRRFAAALHGADVGLFYYSGHGLAVADKNCLVPVDAQIDRASDLDFATVPLDLVTRVLDDEPRTALVFLDACRDNPLARSLARSLGASRSVAVQGGLVSTGAGTGTLIAYATQPRNTASDGAGRNSPFTSALLRHIGEPGVEVRSMLTRVRRDVLAATDGTQEPGSGYRGCSTVSGLASQPPAAASAERTSVRAKSVPARWPALLEQAVLIVEHIGVVAVVEDWHLPNPFQRSQRTLPRLLRDQSFQPPRRVLARLQRQRSPVQPRP
jgi:uncharacterized caspase-like protein